MNELNSPTVHGAGSKRPGKKELAYHMIKEKILDGSLAPLSDISEDDLMEELDVSRTPIREAFQVLEKEGFVYIYPRKGTIVTDITSDLIHQLFEARMLNEPYMARQVCGLLPQEWLLEIRERLSRPFGDPDPLARMTYYTGLDRELHSTILSYNRNMFLKSAMNAVIDHTHRIRIRTSYEPQRYIDSAGEHLSIVDAYLAGDPDQVEHMSREHIITSRTNAQEHFLI